ncbi:hypothetical protein EMIT0P171_30150 [Pseudomonas sp. IT-P171]
MVGELARSRICIDLYFFAAILHSVTQVPDQDTSALHEDEKVGHIGNSDVFRRTAM